ncbi:hypothetical protein NDU88_002450 [Pleurodeles waltl]|uniref:Uncharacterized protein n=1 Tax=Pleurodeles waltl TaxID=8319 RepID=A0AAV7KU80_PLEWA|nr:hypothetical protein NDU88_002450 [Pleurodeles waltl]
MCTLGPGEEALSWTCDQAPRRPLPTLQRSGSRFGELRKQADLVVDSACVMVFPDYTLAVQCQRSNFLAIKFRLRDANVSCSLLYPARLLAVA